MTAARVVIARAERELRIQAERAERRRTVGR